MPSAPRDPRREFTPEEKMQIITDLRAQKKTEDAAWMAQLRAAGLLGRQEVGDAKAD